VNTEKRLPVVLLLLLSVAWSTPAHAVSKNGFKLNDASIPVREILYGGPPRDGIPAINKPKFVTSDAVDFLDDDDRVLGVVIGDIAKAYPIKILDRHEIVNDQSGDQNFVVTYCPLCGTGVVFAANIGEGFLNFGVSGLLYNSDVLLYDRNTESLWSQIMGEAISGELKGVKLPQLPVFHTSWGEWKNRHPDSLVLSTDTGYSINYDKPAYAGYKQSRQLYFKVSRKAPSTYHPKEQVMGLEITGKFKAYPFTELSKNAQADFADEFAGEKFNIAWNEAAQSAHITDADDNVVVTTTGFWFAWFTFHPETEVFKAKAGKQDASE
jgi:uncharacterized protein DUF3179